MSGRPFFGPLAGVHERQHLQGLAAEVRLVALSVPRTGQLPGQGTPEQLGRHRQSRVATRVEERDIGVADRGARPSSVAEGS